MATVGCRGEKPWTPPFCTVVEAETSSFSYLVCSICERPLPDDPNLNPPPPCAVCAKRNPFSSSPSKRLYRLIISVAVEDTVMPVICFDRAARILIGCSADDLFSFCKAHPSAAEKMGEMLEGEMCQMTICEPKSGNAQHLRAVSIVPLRTGFHPVIHALRRFYDVAGPNPSSA